MYKRQTLLRVRRILGPDSYDRFNVYPSAKVLGGPAPGYSSGQALAAMQAVADEVLGEDYSLGWIGSAYQELATQGSGAQAFVFGLILVFLILAAQYELSLIHIFLAVLEVKADAFLFAQALDEAQIALVVLSAVHPLGVDIGAELHAVVGAVEQAVFFEYGSDDLRRGQILEDALIEAVAEVGEGRAQVDAVAGQALARVALGNAVDCLLYTSRCV